MSNETTPSYNSKIAELFVALWPDQLENYELQQCFAANRLQAWKLAIAICKKYECPDYSKQEWYKVIPVIAPPEPWFISEYLTLNPEDEAAQESWELRFQAQQLQGFLEYALEQPEMPVSAVKILADVIAFQTICDQLPLTLSPQSQKLNRLFLTIDGVEELVMLSNIERIQSLIYLLEAIKVKYVQLEKDNEILKTRLQGLSEEKYNSGELTETKDPHLSLLMFGSKLRISISRLSSGLILNSHNPKNAVMVRMCGQRILSILQQLTDLFIFESINLEKVYEDKNMQKLLDILADKIIAKCNGSLSFKNQDDILVWYEKITLVFVEVFISSHAPQEMHAPIAAILCRAIYRSHKVPSSPLYPLLDSLVMKYRLFDIIGVYFLAPNSVFLEEVYASDRWVLFISDSPFRTTYAKHFADSGVADWKKFVATHHDFFELLDWMFSHAWSPCEAKPHPDKPAFFECMIRELLVWPALQADQITDFSLASFVEEEVIDIVPETTATPEQDAQSVSVDVTKNFVDNPVTKFFVDELIAPEPAPPPKPVVTHSEPKMLFESTVASLPSPASFKTTSMFLSDEDREKLKNNHELKEQSKQADPPQAEKSLTVDDVKDEPVTRIFPDDSVVIDEVAEKEVPEEVVEAAAQSKK
jgi:hypothetical protein